MCKSRLSPFNSHTSCWNIQRFEQFKAAVEMRREIMRPLVETGKCP